MSHWKYRQYLFQSDEFPSFVFDTVEIYFSSAFGIFFVKPISVADVRLAQYAN